jgi:4-amino-4-deoxychorismate lyase
MSLEVSSPAIPQGNASLHAPIASFVDGVACSTVALSSRGLAYGDGVFESMRVTDGQVPLWPWHLRRLTHGAAQLRLALDAEAITQELQAQLAGFAEASAKLMLCAASGERGYQRGVGTQRILLVYPAPARSEHALRLCTTQMRLAAQPALAGVKHLNRLEQVLARAEWADEFDEGLMLDQLGRPICATAANIFAHIDGQLLTPSISDCGVRGVMRQVLLDRLDAREAPLSLAQLYRADALFLTNALRGVRAVHSWQSALGTRIFQPSSSAARGRATNETQASVSAVYVQRMLSDLGFKA